MVKCEKKGRHESNGIFNTCYYGPTRSDIRANGSTRPLRFCFKTRCSLPWNFPVPKATLVPRSRYVVQCISTNGTRSDIGAHVTWNKQQGETKQYLVNICSNINPQNQNGKIDDGKP